MFDGNLEPRRRTKTTPHKDTWSLRKVRNIVAAIWLGCTALIFTSLGGRAFDNGDGVVGLTSLLMASVLWLLAFVFASEARDD